MSEAVLFIDIIITTKWVSSKIKDHLPGIPHSGAGFETVVKENHSVRKVLDFTGE
ncbi:MAG: hypothetical protein KJO32_04620 [Deltaproteobacteria bacterium]|nr:hypothetical protein [Deltaproteobacteria bacterium]